jgi:hypothetical protein
MMVAGDSWSVLLFLLIGAGLVLFGLAALIAGIVALGRINRSEGRLRGRGFAIAAIVIGLAMLLGLPVLGVVGAAAAYLNRARYVEIRAAADRGRALEREEEGVKIRSSIAEAHPPSSDPEPGSDAWKAAAARLGPGGADLGGELPTIRTCFREALDAAVARDAGKFFAQVADGAGPDGGIRLVSDEQATDAAARPEFWARNCPDYAALRKAAERMSLTSIEFKRNCAPVYREGSDAKLGTGDRLEMRVKIPGFEDDRHGRLRFTRYEGKWYWIPFGW